MLTAAVIIVLHVKISGVFLNFLLIVHVFIRQPEAEATGLHEWMGQQGNWP